MPAKTSTSDPSVTGFNIGMNTGESAGQTVFHVHIHLILRRSNNWRLCRCPSAYICDSNQDSHVVLPIKFQEPAQEIKKHADTSLEVECRRQLHLSIVKIKNCGEKW